MEEASSAVPANRLPQLAHNLDDGARTVVVCTVVANGRASRVLAPIFLEARSISATMDAVIWPSNWVGILDDTPATDGRRPNGR